LDCCSLLPLSDPQPAVDKFLLIFTRFQTHGLAAGCLFESGSRLQQSKNKGV